MGRYMYLKSLKSKISKRTLELAQHKQVLARVRTVHEQLGRLLHEAALQVQAGRALAVRLQQRPVLHAALRGLLQQRAQLLQLLAARARLQLVGLVGAVLHVQLLQQFGVCNPEFLLSFSRNTCRNNLKRDKQTEKRTFGHFHGGGEQRIVLGRFQLERKLCIAVTIPHKTLKSNFTNKITLEKEDMTQNSPKKKT